MKTSAKQKTPATQKIFKFLKATLSALIVTFALIIIFAFVLKWTSLPDSVIAPVNLVIKGLSVFLGAFIFTKSSSKGILNGIIFALFYTIASFAIFSLLSKEITLGLGLVADFAFNAVLGAIGGIVGVNVKSRK